MSSPVELGEEHVVRSASGLTVRCIEGYDGGLPIHSYQLEVVDDEDVGSLVINRTNPAGANGPVFEVTSLTTGRSYRLFLYAINAKGRSEPAVLEPVTLKGAAMYTTGESQFTQSQSLCLRFLAVFVKTFSLTFLNIKLDRVSSCSSRVQRHKKSTTEQIEIEEEESEI